MEQRKKIVYCDIHEGHIQTMVCLDNKCCEPALACSECIKQNHTDCNKNLIISKEEISEKVIINNLRLNRDQTKSTIRKYIKKHKEHFETRFGIWEKRLIKICNRVTFDDLIDPSFIGMVKRSFHITFLEESEKIKLFNKLNQISTTTLQSLVKTVSEELERSLDEYMEGLDKLRLFESQMYVKDWDIHSEIKTKRIGNGILFKKKASDKNNFSRDILYTVPLDCHCKFKMTINSIDQQNRELSIYVLNRSDKEKGKISSETFDFNYFTKYSGADEMENLGGTTPTDDISDPDGFNWGNEYYIEFFPNKEVHYYNNEKTLDLKGSFDGYEGPFHLLIWLSYSKTSFIMERLF